MNEKRLDQLSRIVIKGFRSIKDCDLELRNINVLIGSNGAGKSNFISVFSLLKAVLEQNLAYYVAKRGGASLLLYNGKRVTDSILAKFHFGSKVYGFKLEWDENDDLFFREERIESDGRTILGDGGYSESKWQEALNNAKGGDEAIKFLAHRQWRIYHFHDTGSTSKIKETHKLSNDEALREDASNLAAFLYFLREHHKSEYNNILHSIKMIAPYFKDFDLKPRGENKEHILLRWKQIDCTDSFNASQLSDGTLRFICLATLLLGPSYLQPSMIIIDEPELGLHPFAITIFAELVKKAAVNKQIILSTQSVELLNDFDPADVVVVDRNENGSDFKRIYDRQSPQQLADWLDDYSLGELWKKNIFGGRFAR